MYDFFFYNCMCKWENWKNTCKHNIVITYVNGNMTITHVKCRYMEISCLKREFENKQVQLADAFPD